MDLYSEYGRVKNQKGLKYFIVQLSLSAIWIAENRSPSQCREHHINVGYSFSVAFFTVSTQSLFFIL